MELDELKNAWRQYDEKLERSLHLNEQLFRSLKLDNTRKAMRGPLFNDIFTILFFAGLFFVGARYFRACYQDGILLISCVTTFVLSLIVMSLYIKKAIALTNIDYYDSSVFDLQRKLSDYQKLHHRIKKIDLLITPLYFGPALLSLKILHNKDVSQIPFIVLFIGITLGLVLGVLIYLWLYKNIYDKQFEATKRFLKELEEFKKEL